MAIAKLNLKTNRQREDSNVNPNNPKIFQFNRSDLTFWLSVFAIAWLLGTVGLSWVINGFLIIVGLIIIAPIIGFLVLRWWLNRNLVTDNCPMCGYQFPSFNQIEFQCPSCGEPLKIEQGRFQRLSPPGTIDVEAVEVSVQPLDSD